MLFGGAAWKVKARDGFIGWSAQQRLSLIVNNSRFLILSHVRVAHLASHILGTILRRLRRDWQSKYQIAPCLAETFVETALRQAEQLAEMSPELERLEAQNVWLSEQLEAKTNRILELEEALEAARRAAHRQAAPFRRPEQKRGLTPKRPGRVQDIPVLFAINPITSTSISKWLCVFVLTAVAGTLLIRPKSNRPSKTLRRSALV